jgi:hypothetical protein
MLRWGQGATGTGATQISAGRWTSGIIPELFSPLGSYTYGRALLTSGFAGEILLPLKTKQNKTKQNKLLNHVG